jgi:hypothetical protein
MNKIKSSVYRKRYKKLINHYVNSRVEGFVELHHIKPKCLGGTNDNKNIVPLPPKAHFIVHYLLWKAYPNEPKLAQAFGMMCVTNKYHHRGRVSSRMYELARVARSNALKGVPKPEWVKEKLRVPKKNKENYKGPKSESHKKNIGKALSKKSKSPTHCDNIKKGMQPYWDKKKKDTKVLHENLRKEFMENDMSRKEFATLHNYSYDGMKKILRGL